MKLKLPSGMYYGEGPNGERICRGAMMGRRDTLPTERNQPLKLRLVRLRWTDQDYDQGGAYWGNTGRDNVYWAISADTIAFGDSLQCAECFVRGANRGANREAAKAAVRDKLPLARFYR